MEDIEERPSKIRKLSSVEDITDPISTTEPSTANSHPQITAVPEESSPHQDDASEEHEDEAEHNDGSTTVQNGDQSQLSKSQRKKIAKKEKWEAAKEYRKVKRREKHKEKQVKKQQAKAELKAKIESGEIEAPPPAPVQQKGNPIQLPITIILDCDFNDLMTEGEIISMGAQITRCHSDNRKALFKSHLVISSFGGALQTRFETVLANTHLSWKGVRFLEKNFVEAASELDGVMRGPGGGKLAGALLPKDDENVETDLPVKATDRAEQDQPSIVYLSSDSPHTLDRLSPNTSYIIGGIVDKNRHKGLCYKRATERGIPTARLPIGEFMTMQSRTVLTVNHVVEIMLKWMETGDWGQAFLAVIPKRKEAKLKNKNAKVGEKQGKEDGEESKDKGSEDDDGYEGNVDMIEEGENTGQTASKDGSNLPADP
ncbi:hypothetical protein HYFRA_00005963 [Hymenoscyphus fraxineus]|uniref:tRNA (guanine(9)-N1)-methyltransferase n=1 Tax=Hymenoscyphus fraxineus TaxID=746836 RepID=A0A9N9KVN9_9HELO|nr:hypothetical protein HYFRA_00005963 [Hymenoscyphus fraxineus]